MWDLIEKLLPAGAGIWSYFTDKDYAKDLRGYATQSGGAIDPFGAGNRAIYQSILNRTYGNASQLENLPGYRFAREQGEKAINRGSARRGQFYSGNVLAELSKFNTGLASQFYDDEMRRLMELSGAGFRPDAGAAGQIYSQGANVAANAPGHLTSWLGASAQGPNSALRGISDLVSGLSGGGGGIGSTLSNISTAINALSKGSSLLSGGISGGVSPGITDTIMNFLGGSTGLIPELSAAASLGPAAVASASPLAGLAGPELFSGFGSAVGGGAGASVGAATPLMSAALPLIFGAPLVAGIMGGKARRSKEASAFAPFVQSFVGQTPTTIGNYSGLAFQGSDNKTYLADPNLAQAGWAEGGTRAITATDPTTGKQGQYSVDGFASFDTLASSRWEVPGGEQAWESMSGAEQADWINEYRTNYQR